MKKIMNNPQNIVIEMINGIVAAHPELCADAKYKFICKKEPDRDKVTLISGGGSGHEPAHAGFVGEGMLDCAVCGDVFASPSQIQVYKAITETAGSKGSLLIIKNYSGDVMNFKNAAELAKEDGIDVDYVIVDDDIAVEDSLYTVGKRGVAGTIFVHKIAGAAAAQGKSLADVKKLAEKTIANVKSIGFALTSCSLPAKGEPIFELGEGDMEYGVGIHGEPGIRREATKTADDLAKDAVSSLIKAAELKADSEVAVMINGFGATPLMELYVLNNSVAGQLHNMGIKTATTFVGNYMTSLDMAGASITILTLDDELKTYLSAPAKTPAFVIGNPCNADDTQGTSFASNPYTPLSGLPVKTGSYTLETDQKHASIVGEKLSKDNMVYIVDLLSQEIIANEAYFCQLDSIAGDGDFGASLAKGFRKLKDEWQDILAKGNDIGGFLTECSLVIMEECGGASGPIWGSAFKGAGKSTKGKNQLSVADFADMLQSAAAAIRLTGERSFGRGAEVGDKTLMDALIPCADAWTAAAKNNFALKEAFAAGVQGAVAGAESTKNITAKMGRAGNVGERSLGHPDAGAQALGELFTTIASAINN